MPRRDGHGGLVSKRERKKVASDSTIFEIAVYTENSLMKELSSE
jgi:hypothetical protein